MYQEQVHIRECSEWIQIKAHDKISNTHNQWRFSWIKSSLKLKIRQIYYHQRTRTLLLQGQFYKVQLKNSSDQQVLASKSLILVFQLFQLVKLVSLDKSLDTLPRIILVNKDQSKFLRSLPKRKLTGFHQANTMDLHWTRFRRALKKFLNKESYSKMKKQSKVRLSSTKRKIRLFSKKNIKVQAFLWLRQ